MPDPNTDEQATAALEKLGERLRAGFTKQNPAQNLDAVRDAIREQYEQEQEAKRSKLTEPTDPTQEREPEEPDQSR